MDVLENMNTAVSYIENHLDEEINYKEVAKIACFSEHHFKRMFSFIAGISLTGYVRRRRLTLAAFDLKESNMRVIDVAVKYGYNSADSFSRAFQALHEVTPSSAKNADVPLKAYPRMTFHIAIKGDVEMNYKFVEKEAFTVVGKKETVPGGSEFNPKMWERLEAIEEIVKAYDNTYFPGTLHVSLTKENGDVDYYIATATTKECPEELEKLEIPSLTWAVFKATGEMPDALLTTWERVYTEWFPTSGYELAEAPEFVRGDDTKTEIWVPVKKKK
ncbi:AraC family transcriptional regulator [Virgibacillus natechei]|uniref:AraC family transcriptional regulator n=1 Tax=Virgibacillus natechei TaxID=1216297 RepID=A0ABS4IK38_9BACI|nr:AraC family transcriptional regulator [Virgibacillus natechei]MBP1971323.1 AraC family transcriptional regulator [Virgibacillus natechei]UZD12942.1 AraC family transcriptional regulator [Virgibacillus natechei]